MAYTFDPIFAADPNNPSVVASNAAILIYNPADTGKAPVTITDSSGSPLSNPITVNKNGFGPAFQHATLDRLAWQGGGFEGYFTSYEGMKNAALAAQTAAENAAGTAGASAAAAVADSLGTAVSDADAAATSANAAAAAAAISATAATDAAALVGAPADVAIAAAINGFGATKTALDATIEDQIEGSAYLPQTYAPSVGSRPGNRWVALGTSLTRGATDDAPIAGKTNIAIQNSWPTWTSMLSDQRITLIKNAGITANTTAMMLARFDADVTPYAPTIVTLDGGTNEFLTGIPFATFKTNFIALIAKIRAIGATPVIASILPNQSQRQLAASWYKWQKAYAAQEGIEFLDFWTLLVDPTTGIFNGTAGSSDGTHPGLGGYLAMATLAREKLLALVPSNKPPILTDNIDTDSILNNPLFLGTAVGGLAPSWQAEAAPAGSTFSVITDTTIALGKLQMVERNATAADTILQQGTGLSGNPKVSIGDRIIVTGKIWTSSYFGAKSGNDIIRLDFGGGNYRDLYIGAAWLDQAGGARFYHEAVVPAGAIQIKVMYIGNAGSGTAKLGQVTVINATRLSMVVGSAY